MYIETRTTLCKANANLEMQALLQPPTLRVWALAYGLAATY